MKHAPIGRILVLGLFALTAGCSEESTTPQDVAGAPAMPAEAAPTAPADTEVTRTAGECKAVFDGEICTWGDSRGDELVAFGATVPMSTVESAPPEGEMVMPPVTLARVRLPESVRNATGVDHLGVNWEVYGHPPTTFMTPHFDFHFYTWTGAEIEAIDCSNLTKPETLPAGYILPDIGIPEMQMTLVGLCVPEMGMHGVLESEYQNTEFFDGSMIIGYYEQEIIFIEPMVAKAHLMKRQDFALDMPKLEGRGDGIATPSDFEATYDADQDAYHLVFNMAGGE
ncbi:MAG: hypothetical protein GWM87_14155 [Xanthomonadales bacterium]|nr:hypothetical protein [Xanthomonadales bacterium]NIX13955.1 hypothetical protein [Xanthomonadales bacterium]